ncbi:MAG: hypothetical protein Fur0018_24020 [Anaerolineales bacterium]
MNQNPTQDILADIVLLIEAGHYRQAQEKAERLCETAQSSEMQVIACRLMAQIAKEQGHVRQGLNHLIRALAVLDEHDDQRARADLSIDIGLTYIALGLPGMAKWHFEEAMRLYTALGNQNGQATALNRLGVAALMLKNYPAARKRLQESLALSRQIGDIHLTAGACVNLGEVERLSGQMDVARKYYLQAGEMFEAQGLQRGVLIVENNLGHIATASGDLETARGHYHRAAELGLAMEAVPHMLDTLAGLAILMAREGALAAAAPLFAFILNNTALLDETRDLLQGYLASAEVVYASPAPVPQVDDVSALLERTCQQVFGTQDNR